MPVHLASQLSARLRCAASRAAALRLFVVRLSSILSFAGIGGTEMQNPINVSLEPLLLFSRQSVSGPA